LEKLETYCTGSFLESVYSRTNVLLGEFLLAEKDGLWLAELYRLLHGNCLLITDLSKEEIIRRSIDIKAADYNPNFRKLWKNGSAEIVSYPETFTQMQNEADYFKGKTNELYFLSANKEFCTETGTNFGILCSCPDIMDSHLPRMFNFGIKSLNKEGKVKSWDFLAKYRYPSNSAVIADNYILKDKVEENLLKILLNIMPHQLDETYDLTIFTRDIKNSDHSFDVLNARLKGMFSYEVNLSIGIVDQGSLGIHDRDILTNCCWYGCGAGFNLFSSDGKKTRLANNTKVMIYPVTYIGSYFIPAESDEEEQTPVQNCYFSALKNFKKVWRELPDKKGIYKTFIGKRSNRLLD
jgi:hypothetical protein